MKSFQKAVFAVAALVLLIASGCKQPYDYTMQRSRIFLMARLVVGKACDVRVIWRKAPNDETPVTVMADLSKIGGQAEQELVPDDNNTGIWRWRGQVTPEASGERIITITSLDSQDQKKVVRKGFPVFSDGKAVAIGASVCDRAAVKADGTVVTWQILYTGSIIPGPAPPTGLSDAVAVIGDTLADYPDPFHIFVDEVFFALKAEGTVAAWGGDNGPEIIPSAGLDDVVAIAANARSYLALKADGTVVAWGHHAHNVPADLTDVIAIATADDAKYALRADGSLVSWSGDESLQVIDEHITSVSAAFYGCLYVVDENGTANSDCFIHGRIGGGFKTIAASTLGQTGIGLRYNGSVVSWKKLSLEDYVNEGPEHALAIAISQYDNFCLTLTENGTVRDWADAWWGHREHAVPDELR